MEFDTEDQVLSFRTFNDFTIVRRDKLISDHQMYQKKSEQSIMKALKMSLFHVLFFVFSWTPYSAMATW